MVPLERDARRRVNQSDLRFLQVIRSVMALQTLTFVLSLFLQFCSVPEDVGDLVTVRVLNGKDTFGVQHEPDGDGELREDLH